MLQFDDPPRLRIHPFAQGAVKINTCRQVGEVYLGPVTRWVEYHALQYKACYTCKPDLIRPAVFYGYLVHAGIGVEQGRGVHRRIIYPGGRNRKAAHHANGLVERAYIAVIAGHGNGIRDGSAGLGRRGKGNGTGRYGHAGHVVGHAARPAPHHHIACYGREGGRGVKTLSLTVTLMVAACDADTAITKREKA